MRVCFPSTYRLTRFMLSCLTRLLRLCFVCARYQASIASNDVRIQELIRLVITTQ